MAEAGWAGGPETLDKVQDAALARSELKYRNLFQCMPVALCQLDVTDLVAALARLRADGVTDLADHFDKHPDLIWHLLELLRIEEVNQHMVEMFGGRDPAEFVGPIARFWHGGEDSVRRSMCAHFAGAQSYADEARMCGLDGKVVNVFYTCSFPTALGEMGIGLVGMIDIGARLEAERMLQQIQADFAHAARVATLGELTASIAHEINQPLSAIAVNGKASLRWLDRAEPNVDEAREVAARIVADADRAADVIRRIRAMATPQPEGRELLSVNDVAAETLAFLQRDLQAKEVRVEFEPADDLPLVEADRTELQQVLVNLAVNAEQAMAQHDVKDRRLAVRTSSAPGYVSVEIEDNGPGVAPDMAERLFDRFVTTKPNGLGIGLSICRSIVEAYGGRISVASSETGARFTFALPAARPVQSVGASLAPA